MPHQPIDTIQDMKDEISLLEYKKLLYKVLFLFILILYAFSAYFNHIELSQVKAKNIELTAHNDRLIDHIIATSTDSDHFSIE